MARGGAKKGKKGGDDLDFDAVVAAVGGGFKASAIEQIIIGTVAEWLAWAFFNFLSFVVRGCQRQCGSRWVFFFFFFFFFCGGVVPWLSFKRLFRWRRGGALEWQRW